MLLQFEITTRCNFDCFYCAGRTMRQGDMPYETFIRLLNQHVNGHGTPTAITLQGEGEPTLHKDFFRMAEYIHHTVGSVPYSITNGTYKHPERFIGLFPKLGVSVDTLDDSVATKIGRHNLPRVLSFIDALAPHLTIVIHSVHHPRYTPPVADWCKERGFHHLIQPLQRKPDYGRRYLPPEPVPDAPGRFSCVYLKRARMRYYSLDGHEMPCCYIKDTNQFEGLDAMLSHQEKGTWPACCVGCRVADPNRPHQPQDLSKPSEAN